jgi:hypothetical protein
VYYSVSRYGSQANGLGAEFGKNIIQYWEVLNEVDMPLGPPYGDGQFYTAEQMTIRGQAYGELFKRTVEIIKLADQNAKIITSGLADYNSSVGYNRDNVLPQTQTFINAVAQTGALNKADGFGFHPYNSTAYDNHLHLTALLDTLSADINTKAQKELPLWLTEFGIGSTSLAPSCQYCLTTAETEGKILLQNLLQIAANSHVQGALYYQLAPTTIPDTSNEDTLAMIVKPDVNSPWIESNRFKVFNYFNNTILPFYTYNDYQLEGTNHVYHFTANTADLYVIWSPSPSIYSFTNQGTTIRLYDQYGQETALTASLGSMQITISDEPSYLVISKPSSSPSPSPTPAASGPNLDFNHDGTTNSQDLMVLISKMYNLLTIVQDEDLNHDSKINSVDFAHFLQFSFL